MSIRILDNFINKDDLNTINEYVDEKGYTYGWKSNLNQDYRHWNLLIAGSKNHDTEYEIKEEEINNPFFWNLWKRININNKQLVRLYSNAYTYGTEGAIHIDSKKPSAQTHMLYINDTWKADWAGETVFIENNDVIGSVLPKPGRLIEFPGTLRHAARSVSKFCPVVRKVLVFKSV